MITLHSYCFSSCRCDNFHNKVSYNSIWCFQYKYRLDCFPRVDILPLLLANYCYLTVQALSSTQCSILKKITLISLLLKKYTTLRWLFVQQPSLSISVTLSSWVDWTTFLGFFILHNCAILFSESFFVSTHVWRFALTISILFFSNLSN